MLSSRKSTCLTKLWTELLLFLWNEQCARVLSHSSWVQLLATIWAGAHQAPLSIGFSRQEYWSGLPFLSPGDLPDPGIKSASLVSSASQIDSLLLTHWGSPIMNNNYGYSDFSIWQTSTQNEPSKPSLQEKQQYLLPIQDFKQIKYITYIYNLTSQICNPTRLVSCLHACSGISDSLQLHGLQPTRLLCPWNFQARILEWVAISYSRGSSQMRDQTCISRRSFTV